jgi:hypothetical protein
MNQKQRQYIVRELQIARDSKINAITKGNGSIDENNGIIKLVVAAIKSGDIVKGHSDIVFSQAITDYTTPKYMKKMITRDFGYFNSGGNLKIKCSSLISAIKEFSANAWSIEKCYNHKRAMNSFITGVKDGCADPSKVDLIVASIGDGIDGRIRNVEAAYKAAERKTMLADSEEMMAAIEAFEALEF